MAYSSTEFLLKELKIDYGTWANPASITPAADPTSSFTKTDDFGYLRQGTIVITLTDEFVEYLSGTPQKIIRKDLIRRNYGWEFTANQFNEINFDILYNFDSQTTGDYDLYHIGSDAPVKLRYGFYAYGQLVDGTAFKAAIWAGEVVTEDKTLNFAGTDYVDIPVMIQAFEHSDYVSSPNDQRNYGLIWLPGDGS